MADTIYSQDLSRDGQSVPVSSQFEQHYPEELRRARRERDREQRKRARDAAEGCRREEREQAQGNVPEQEKTEIQEKYEKRGLEKK